MMYVNVELHYWELELELVSNQCLSLPNCNLSLPNSDLSLPNRSVIVLYFRHCLHQHSIAALCMAGFGMFKGN